MKRKLFLNSTLTTFITIFIALTSVLVFNLTSCKPVQPKVENYEFKVVMQFEDLAEKPVLKVKLNAQKGETVTLKHKDIERTVNLFFKENEDKYKYYSKGFDEKLSTKSIVAGESDTFTAFFLKKTYTITFSLKDTYVGVPLEIKNPVTLKHGENLAKELYNKTLKIKNRLASGIEQNLLHFIVKETGKQFDIAEKYTQNIELIPVFENYFAVKYLIEIEQIDGSFETKEIVKKAKQSEKHTVEYNNTDPHFEAPEFSKTDLIVDNNENNNTVNIKLKRKRYKIEFNVVGHTGKINTKTIVAGAKIGEFENPFSEQFETTYFISGQSIELTQLKEMVPSADLTIDVQVKDIFTQNSKYPQTKFNLNQADIKKTVHFTQNLNFNSGKQNNFSFKRTFVYTKNEEVFEKYAGEYFKFEEIEFEQIPGKTTFYTKKILDFVPFNVYQEYKISNALFENSILKALIENISKIANLKLTVPTYDDSDFGVKAIAENSASQNKLIKTATDYSNAVFGKQRGELPLYRNTKFNFNPYNKPRTDWMPLYENGNEEIWWLGTKGKSIFLPKAYYITKDGQPGEYFVNAVLGLVLAKH